MLSSHTFFTSKATCYSILKRYCKCTIFISLQLSSMFYHFRIIRKRKSNVFSGRPQGGAQYFLFEKASIELERFAISENPEGSVKMMDLEESTDKSRVFDPPNKRVVL